MSNDNEKSPELTLLGKSDVPFPASPEEATLESFDNPSPDRDCIETKSLKFYLASYRNCAAFNEAVANRIADDITAAVAPRGLEMRAEFAARGGISLSVEVSHP